jgi:hypothetical protein
MYAIQIVDDVVKGPKSRIGHMISSFPKNHAIDPEEMPRWVLEFETREEAVAKIEALRNQPLHLFKAAWHLIKVAVVEVA